MADTRFHHKARKKVVEKLGNKCVRCGFSDYRALQIDHIHGGGQHDLRDLGFKSAGYSFFIYLLTLPDDDLFAKYQLLCANCNWIKRAENKESRGCGSPSNTYTNRFLGELGMTIDDLRKLVAEVKGK